jgi:serine/threonine protein kinase
MAMAMLDSVLAWLRREHRVSASATPAPVRGAAPAPGSLPRHGPYRGAAVEPVDSAASWLRRVERFAGYEVVTTIEDGPGPAKYLIESPAKPLRCAVTFFDVRPGIHRSEWFAMRFDEARPLLGLRHPNQGRVLELGHDDGVAWLLAEYPRGETLHGLQRRVQRGDRRPSLEVILAAFADFAEGLHAAHVLTTPGGDALALRHGHLVPNALLLSRDGKGKVVDWGAEDLIAAYLGSRADVPLRPTRLRHVAPEMVRGLPFDGRADVFALGVMLYDLTTGGSLFLAKTELDTLMEVMKADPPRPSTRVAGYPPALEALVLRALAKDPAARATAGEVAAALRALLAKRGVEDPAALVAAYVGSLKA